MLVKKKQMSGKKTNQKIKSSKSEAIYDVFIKTLNCSSNYYEKEAFVYHHSVVSHDIKKYRLKSNEKCNSVSWSFTISACEMVQFKCKDGTPMNVFLESIALQNKVNSLVNYILKN